MSDLIQLLTFESHKLMMATSPHLKHQFKEKIQKVLQQPQLTEAVVIESMKKAQRELELRLKSHPDAKNAMIAGMIVYCVLLRNQVREMLLLARLPGQEASSQLSRLGNVFLLASMIQPLLKQANAHQIEVLQGALRRIR